MAKNEINDQLLVRRQKLEELKEMGIEPFGRKYDREALARDLDEKYLGLEKDELNANMPKTKTTRFSRRPTLVTSWALKAKSSRLTQANCLSGPST